MAAPRASLLAVVAPFAALALTLVRCAHIEPPSGGPVDTKPPAVVAVYPAPGARNVPLDAPVVFQFSEWIDRNGARSQAFVSPPTRGRLRVTAEGSKLQVRPSEISGGWRANTAYQVIVLPSLQDLHAVRAGKPFSLRFSTGQAVDVGALAGTALSPAPKGTLMAALYHAGNPAERAGVEALSTRAVDFKPAALPEPWRELPAFLALADSSGAFRFDSVAQGDYSLFAFEDVNGNFSFDLGFENAAMGPLSIALRPRAADRVLRVAPLDTLPPAPYPGCIRGGFAGRFGNFHLRRAGRGQGPGRVLAAAAPRPRRRGRALPDSAAGLGSGAAGDGGGLERPGTGLDARDGAASSRKRIPGRAARPPGLSRARSLPGRHLDVLYGGRTARHGFRLRA